MTQIKSHLHVTQHSFKCFLKSCIEFNNGLFHIFSGPLFANVEGYVYFDLLIWGLSPITFLLLRPKMTQLLKEGGYKVKKTTLRTLLIICLIMIISYFFLNYSPQFNWNYFSRTFNLDMGYFVFDMLLRTFDLIVDLQEQQNAEKQCDAYCEIQHAGIAVAYVSVFFLASFFEVNQRNNGPIIFGLSCSFSCVSILLIPIIYFCQYKQLFEEGYESLEGQQANRQNQINLESDTYQKIQEQSITKFTEIEDRNQITVNTIGFFGIYVSLLINMNYFSLWMMEPLGTDTQSSYQQYNITIQMVSGFFMVSSVGNYICARMFVFFKSAKIMAKTSLMLYSLFILLIYQFYEVNYVSIVVLGFGFHSVCIIQMGSLFADQYNIDNSFYLYCEVFAYFLLPLCCTLTNIGQQSLQAYALISGLFLLFGSILA